LVAARFEELGLEVETLRLLPTKLSPNLEFAAEETIDMTERISVVGRLPGAGSGKSMLFFGHPDGEPFTEESLDGWEHDPFAGEAVGRSTNLLTSHVSCGTEGRTTQVPTECVIEASTTFPPNEQMPGVQQDVQDAIDRVVEGTRPRTPGTRGLTAPGLRSPGDRQRAAGGRT
jgi:acetylornithine deacetylase/succinyl-diaminopimelate desuccinylase-like protein